MVGLSFPKSWRAFSVRLVSNCVRLGWTCVLMSRALVRGTFSCRANRIILLTIDEVDEAGRASDKRVPGWQPTSYVSFVFDWRQKKIASHFWNKKKPRTTGGGGN